MSRTRLTFVDLISPGSLRTQLLSRALLILAVVLVLIGSFQYLFMRDIVYRSKAVSLESQVRSIPPPIWERLIDNIHLQSSDLPKVLIPDASLAFIDTDGNYIVISEGQDEIVPPRLETQVYWDASRHKPSVNYRIINAPGTEQLVVLHPIRGNMGSELVGTVQISTPTGPLKELLFKQVLAFIFLSLAALLLGLLVFLPALKKTMVPLSNMVKTAGQIDAGNLDKRFPTQQGQVEIDALAESFNSMLGRLESSFAAEKETQEQMRRFIADASHELRTPLTAIHGFLEVLLRGAKNQPEELDKALQSMHSESHRLNKLVHDLLLLTKLDRTPQVELVEVPMDRLIRDMEPQLRILAGSRKLELIMDPDSKGRVNSDQIKQVILNLFQNAVQHTDPAKGYIKLSLSQQPDGLIISVQDNGPGISSEHLPHIFDRFYRSDSSRTRKYGGAGLGLSITKSIVEVHGGTINVVSDPEQGCTFSVWLPK